jgi:type VI secretion system secreted protein VgrG
MVNGWNPPPWKLPDNQALSGTVSRDLEGGYNGQSSHFVLDDTPGQLQAQLASDHAQSRLVLGYNTRIVREAGRKEARGEGWELATGAWGVARAGRGMLITTDARDGADATSAPAKDVGEAVARLTQARDIHERLAGLARQYEAQEPQTSQRDVSEAIRAQNDAIRGSTPGEGQPFPQLARPDIVLASAAGVGVTGVESAHVASAEHVALTAGGHVSIAAVKSLLASAVKGVRVFAQHLGIRIRAAAGKVLIEAQRDDVEVIAQRVVSIISRTDSINLMASNEIVFHAGTTKVVINAQGYRVYTAGEHRVHARDHETDVPVATPPVTPMTDVAQAKVAEHFVLTDEGMGLALPQQRYRITLNDGQVIDGTSNQRGETSLAMSKHMQIATLALLRSDGSVLSLHQPILTQDAKATFDPAQKDPT